MNPLNSALRLVLVRDLRSVSRQLAAYPSDEAVWELAPGVTNSAGTLALHVAGNVQHFIGAVLGGSGYVRYREAEFARRDLPRALLLTHVDAAIHAVETTLPRLSSDQLEQAYPVPIGERSLRTADFLVHLVAHLGYHLGQIDYHRRILTSGAEPLETVSLRELPEFSP